MSMFPTRATTQSARLYGEPLRNARFMAVSPPSGYAGFDAFRPRARSSQAKVQYSQHGLLEELIL